MVNANGDRRQAGKWEGQNHEQFDKICSEILQFEKRTEGLPPIYEGELDWNFAPS